MSKRLKSFHLAIRLLLEAIEKTRDSQDGLYVLDRVEAILQKERLYLCGESEKELETMARSDVIFPHIWDERKAKFNADSVCLAVLPKEKRLLFDPLKPLEELTEKDIIAVLEKVLPIITPEDFVVFRELVMRGEERETGGHGFVDEQYPYSREGFTSYLYFLLVDTGLYFMGLYLFARESNREDVKSCEPVYSSAMFEILWGFAGRFFQEV